MTRLSPIEVDCPTCGGVGRDSDDPYRSCVTCDGSGKAWGPGAPLFDCTMTLAKRKVGEIVTLGNGDRGRVLAHDRREPQTTRLGLIGDFDDVESHTPTTYPSCVGVSSVADPRFFHDDAGHEKSHEDVTDPMRKRST